MALIWASMTHTQVLLVKTNNERIFISVGDFIKYKGRPDGVRVESFTHCSQEAGPIGMTYLPWRAKDRCWATLSYSLRGNNRHIIASPYGINHYGEHIDWDSVVHLGKPPVPRIYYDGQWGEEWIGVPEAVLPYALPDALPSDALPVPCHTACAIDAAE